MATRAKRPGDGAKRSSTRGAAPPRRTSSRTPTIVAVVVVLLVAVVVIGGVLRAVAQRVPAHVVGDGEHGLAELVEITNADPRRGIGHEKVLTRIKVDEESTTYAREQGFETAAKPTRRQTMPRSSR